MLVLSRHEGQKIHIGDDVVLTVVRVGKSKCRIGVDAPVQMKIWKSLSAPAMKPEAEKGS